jgi:anti-anti-sigma regulatory factor
MTDTTDSPPLQLHATPPAVPEDHDGLIINLEQQDHRLVLHLAGDLDLANAGYLPAAMRWLRSRWQRLIVVDARRLTFVDLTGYRMFFASMRRPDGSWDPRTVYVTGDVIGRMRGYLAAITGSVPLVA